MTGNRKKAHLPGSPLQPQALVAAATLLNKRRLHRGEFSTRPWQDEAWAHYDSIGELRYATRYESNAVSRARLIAARIPDDPSANPEPLPPNHPASELMDQFLGGRDKQADALARLDTQLYMTGISYLVGFEEAEKGETVQRWFVLTADEIRMEDDDSVILTLNEGGGTRLGEDGGNIRLNRDSVVIMRIWTPHARRWYEPDSAVRGVLPILRELDGLTKHVSATIDSRLAGAGLLVLPNEMVFSSNRDDLQDGEDPFVVELIEAMMTPIENRDTAAAVVPLVIKVPGQYVDSIQHIRFGTEFDAQTRDLREETIRRLALGLDIPPEILLGVGDVNHWTAWQIDESSVKLHIEPKLATITAGITAAYLHPALRAMGEETDNIVVIADTTSLKLRPNRATDAESLHGDMLISDDARRKASGFGEDDAPDAEAKFQMLLEHVLINSPQMSMELLPALARLMGADSPEIREIISLIDKPEPEEPGVSKTPDPEADSDPTPDGQGDDSPAAP